MVFNNGDSLFEHNPQSYIVEINGFIDADGNDTGSYINPPDAGYYTLEYADVTHKQPKQTSNQTVWMYGSKRNTSFFNSIASGSQRLPNGNTLIFGSSEGHIFEVTREGEVVWEYINPVTRKGDILEFIPDSYPMSNMVIRAWRFTPDHPALTDRDLTPKGTISGKKGFQIIK